MKICDSCEVKVDDKDEECWNCGGQVFMEP